MSDSDEFDDFEDRIENVINTEAGESIPTTPESTDNAMPTTADGTPLGHLTASEGLDISRGDSTIHSYIRSNTRDELRLGDFIQVPYPSRPDDPHSELLGEVARIGYEQRADIDDKSDVRRGIRDETIDERQYVQVADIEPIAIVEGTDSDELTQTTVDRILKPFTLVYKASDDAFLRTGLNLAAEGPYIGDLAVSGEPHPPGDPLAYRLPTVQGTPAIWTHMLIAGATDAGKTFTTKNILRQLATDTGYEVEVRTGDGDTETRERALGIVVIDPENEYSGLGKDPDLPDDVWSDLESRGIEVGGIDTPACGSHDLQTYVPVADGISTPAIDGAREFGIPFGLVENRPELVMGYQPPSATENAIKECIGTYFDGPGASNPSYEEYLRFLRGNEDQLQAQHNIASQSWDAMMSRVDSGVFHQVFDAGTHQMIEITNELFRPGRVTVIPTRHLIGGEEADRGTLVVMALLSYIVQNKLGGNDPDPNVDETPLLLVVDEAHEYLSGADSLHEREVVSRFRRIAKRGRKYGLGLCMITQDPSDIDGEILGQTRTGLYLEMESNADLSSVPAGYEDDVTKFEQGQGVIESPGVRPTEIRTLGHCTVDHD
jgi:hypothetical protein